MHEDSMMEEYEEMKNDTPDAYDALDATATTSTPEHEVSSHRNRIEKGPAGERGGSSDRPVETQ